MECIVGSKCGAIVIRLTDEATEECHEDTRFIHGDCNLKFDPNAAVARRDQFKSRGHVLVFGAVYLTL